MVSFCQKDFQKNNENELDYYRHSVDNMYKHKNRREYQPIAENAK